MHDVASLESLKVPNGHGKQDDLSMKVPAGQEPQADAPAGEDSPGAHGSQSHRLSWSLSSPTVSRNDPAGQFAHEAKPSAAAYIPTAHTEQATLPVVPSVEDPATHELQSS